MKIPLPRRRLPAAGLRYTEGGFDRRERATVITKFADSQENLRRRSGSRPKTAGQRGGGRYCATYSFQEWRTYAVSGQKRVSRCLEVSRSVRRIWPESGRKLARIWAFSGGKKAGQLFSPETVPRQSTSSTARHRRKPEATPRIRAAAIRPAYTSARSDRRTCRA